MWWSHSSWQMMVVAIVLHAVIVVAATAAGAVAFAPVPVVAGAPPRRTTADPRRRRPPRPPPPMITLEAAARRKTSKERSTATDGPKTTGTRGGAVVASAKKTKKSGGGGFGRNNNVDKSSPRAIVVEPDDDDDNNNARTTTSTNTEVAAAEERGGGLLGVAHADLLSWMRNNPNAYVSPKFVIRPSTLGGCGGFVDSCVRTDELLLRVPRECCVTQEDALDDARWGDGFRRLGNEGVSSYGMLLIAGWIAMEQLASSRTTTEEKEEEDDGGGRRRSRLPYLRSLPWERGGTSGQDHVLFWSDEEVRTLLGGSRAYDDALLIRKTVDDAVKLMKDFVVPTDRDVMAASRRCDQDGNEEIDPAAESTPDEGLDRAVRGAFVIALSRSFAEEVEHDNIDGTTVVEVENVLLPLIDILQHSNVPNTILEPYDDYVLLRAGRDLGAGEELFHRYREENDDVIPPHKFFTRYGFVPGVKEPVAELLKRRSHLFFDS